MNVETEKEEKEVEGYEGQGEIRCGILCLECEVKSIQLGQNSHYCPVKDEGSCANGLVKIDHIAPAIVKL